MEVAFPEDLGRRPPPTMGLASYPDRSGGTSGYDAVTGLAVGRLLPFPLMGERTEKDGVVLELRTAYGF